MKLSEIIGHDLDKKYRIESEIGRGGMGTVYLATHLGTERPVAVKIVSPQFMKRPEFVERFRREARAAGRLRHPNVVDVTDFGIADTDDGQVAYLVMEYLDGCTLGEVLDEEHHLPVNWVLDIVDQICSAVNEAHEAGIIHRDLKPDNIWLEPNQRGGYTVKVLDFGIAKVNDGIGAVSQSDVAKIAESIARPTAGGFDRANETNFQADLSQETVALDGGTSTALGVQATLIGETKTLIQTPEGDTYAFETGKEPISDPETIGTRLIETGVPDAETPANADRISLTSARSATSGSTNLTRVGAVLGTPLYMSPEQCRSEPLDARSDIYSIGIMTYQMLSGRTPFEGEWKEVMEAHKFAEPPPLQAKKVRRKLKRVIMSALAKDPNDRPESAQALAIALRSRADGIFGLLRRAGMIYTEQLPRFVFLAAFFALPLFLLTFALIGNIFLQMGGVVSRPVGNAITGALTITATLISAFTTYLTIGTICWVVTQILSVPLRPLSLRRALKAAARKWRTFAGTGVFTTILSFVVGGAAGIAGFLAGLLVLSPFMGFDGPTIPIAGAFAAFIGVLAFLIFSVMMMLLGPVVMMEDLRGIRAMRRSAQLIRRSYLTSFSAFAITFAMPLVTAGVLSVGVQLAAVSLDPSLRTGIPNITINGEKNAGSSADKPEETAAPTSEGEKNHSITIDRSGVTITEEGGGSRSAANTRRGLKQSILESLMQILLLPIQILIISFTSIMIALLYLKTRQAGGESLQSLLYHFEGSDGSPKQWQKRIKRRLVQSGRLTPKSE